MKKNIYIISSIVLLIVAACLIVFINKNESQKISDDPNYNVSKEAIQIINTVRKKYNKPELTYDSKLAATEHKVLEDANKNNVFLFHNYPSYGYINSFMENQGLIKHVNDSYYAEKVNRYFLYVQNGNFFENNGVGFTNVKQFLCGQKEIKDCGSHSSISALNGLLGHSGHRESLLDFDNPTPAKFIGCAGIFQNDVKGPIKMQEGEILENKQIKILSENFSPPETIHSFFGCLQY